MGKDIEQTFTNKYEKIAKGNNKTIHKMENETHQYRSELKACFTELQANKTALNIEEAMAASYKQVCIYMYICMYVYMYICIYVSMYLCIYVYMCICIYVYMYICNYILKDQ